jgi:hypothetical protein
MFGGACIEQSMCSIADINGRCPLIFIKGSGKPTCAFGRRFAAPPRHLHTPLREGQ